MYFPELLFIDGFGMANPLNSCEVDVLPYTVDEISTEPEIHPHNVNRYNILFL